ncbi:hypothetical protein [Wukongibacter baidiensis]
MRDQITKLIKEEEGAIGSIIILILIPILVYILISAPNLARYQRATNTVLQNAVDYAVKDAATMVDEESQALGEPRIDYAKAKERFLESLAYNINAYSEEGSSFEDVEYSLLIYNGDDKYKGYDGGKIASYAFFTKDDSVITNSIDGFPVKLGITEDGITDKLYETDINVSVDRPFVLAVVKARIVSILDKKSNNEGNDKEGVYVTRWSLGEIRVRKVDD